MRKVKYGNEVIEYTILEKEGLKSHYITVEKHTGVVLKGKLITPDVADTMILKKAPWIIKKLHLVASEKNEEIVTGSRINYLGKSYYVKVVQDSTRPSVVIEFNYSRFTIHVPAEDTNQEQIKNALEDFYKMKAIEKIAPRVKQIAAKTNLPYKGLSFRKMSKRWGSCTVDNKIILNFDAVKLPYTLIDYLIIHELCHTKVKDHSKAYWAELQKHIPNWRALDQKINAIKF